jgi:hypothetical protein
VEFNELLTNNCKEINLDTTAAIKESMKPIEVIVDEAEKNLMIWPNQESKKAPCHRLIDKLIYGYKYLCCILQKEFHNSRANLPKITTTTSGWTAIFEGLVKTCHNTVTIQTYFFSACLTLAYVNSASNVNKI